MTRAKDELHLLLPQRFFAHQQRVNGDRHMYAAQTRFIPESILHNFDNVAWPQAPAESTIIGKPQLPVDIGARM